MIVDKAIVDKMVVDKVIVDKMVVDKVIVDKMVVDKVIVDKMVVDKMTSGSNCLAPKRSHSSFWVASLSPFFIIFVFFQKTCSSTGLYYKNFTIVIYNCKFLFSLQHM
jgi:hypothetical protein